MPSFFFQAEDGIRDLTVTGVQTCALPIYHLYVARAPAPEPMVVPQNQLLHPEARPQHVAHELLGSEPRQLRRERQDRKSTRLNSSHSQISYAVFCLKKKKKHTCRRARRVIQLIIGSQA